jgi:hypothetical protein
MKKACGDNMLRAASPRPECRDFGAASRANTLVALQVYLDFLCHESLVVSTSVATELSMEKPRQWCGGTKADAMLFIFAILCGVSMDQARAVLDVDGMNSRTRGEAQHQPTNRPNPGNGQQLFSSPSRASAGQV